MTSRDVILTLGARSESHLTGDTRRISYALPRRAKGTPSRRGRRHGGHATPPLRA